ncbi:restriction endonuclease subunit S [Burkholderia cepacia]|uniref:restriction endonuclease subunit S n=1 Tax=Burkholderia cepacia TaxID=292 RepID=UPI0029905C30|nr:restriction endonuclease subunit S [Burkholderia cepacia]
MVIANVGANAGTVFRVPSLRKPATLGPNAVRVRPNEAAAHLLTQDYLYYYLVSPTGQADIQSIITGSAQPKFNKTALRALSIRVPSLAQQNAVSSVVKCIDDRIALLRETNATLEAIAQALFKSWFVDFDPVRAKAEGREPEGLDADIAALFPDGFEESELGLVPRGWRHAALSEAYDVNPGRALKRSTSAPYVDMAAVGTTGHTVARVITRELGSGSKFINGDTLLARITPCLENGKTAFVDFWPKVRSAGDRPSSSYYDRRHHCLPIMVTCFAVVRYFENMPFKACRAPAGGSVSRLMYWVATQ